MKITQDWLQNEWKNTDSQDQKAVKTAKQDKYKIIPWKKKRDNFGYLITQDLRELQNAKQQQN